MPRQNLNDLVAFLVVVRDQSFTRAAARHEALDRRDRLPTGKNLDGVFTAPHLHPFQRHRSTQVERAAKKVKPQIQQCVSVCLFGPSSRCAKFTVSP